MSLTASAAEVAREVAVAERRIRPYVRETPLDASPFLGRETGVAVYLKLECAQVTGSFKARGAFNALAALTPKQRSGGIIAASTGNHALAVALALTQLGIDGEIFLPRSITSAKLDGLRIRNARLRLLDRDPGLVESAARTEAERSGRAYISPYNDLQVVAGQGTIAPELLRQLDGLDAVFVPVGGGGLASGIGAYFAAHAPSIRMIGCQPAAAPIMAKSVRAGQLVELTGGPSLADATLGLIEPGAITFPLCQTLVREWVEVDEAAIGAAIRLVLENEWLLIEGAAALAVAGFLATREQWRGARVALVLTGSHIALPVLAQVLAKR